VFVEPNSSRSVVSAVADAVGDPINATVVVLNAESQALPLFNVPPGSSAEFRQFTVELLFNSTSGSTAVVIATTTSAGVYIGSVFANESGLWTVQATAVDTSSGRRIFIGSDTVIVGSLADGLSTCVLSCELG
jgi:hypothetical protein